MRGTPYNSKIHASPPLATCGGTDFATLIFARLDRGRYAIDYTLHGIEVSAMHDEAVEVEDL